MASKKHAGYKLATYQSKNGPRAALVVEDRVFDAAALTGNATYATVIAILADWRAVEAHCATLRRASAPGASGRGQFEVSGKWLIPTRRPTPANLPNFRGRKDFSSLKVDLIARGTKSA